MCFFCVQNECVLRDKEYDYHRNEAPGKAIHQDEAVGNGIEAHFPPSRHDGGWFEWQHARLVVLYMVSTQMKMQNLSITNP